MYRRLPNPFMMLVIIFLAGCSSQQELRQIHHEVATLNQQMEQLTQQTSTLTRQNALNAHSTNGAWLLPAANTPVHLQSQLGELRLALGPLTTTDDGIQGTLIIHPENNQPLPAFSVNIVWGQFDETTDKPLESTSHSQRLSSPANSGLEVTIPFHLPNTGSPQPDYIRIHDIQPQTSHPLS